MERINKLGNGEDKKTETKTFVDSFLPFLKRTAGFATAAKKVTAGTDVQMVALLKALKTKKGKKSSKSKPAKKNASSSRRSRSEKTKEKTQAQKIVKRVC